MQTFSDVSNEDLLQSLHRLAGSQRSVLAELVLHLAEVDARRLYADRGFPSLFSYCTEELKFSEDEACRRIDAARMGRRFPLICEHLKSGAATLSVVCLLKAHLTQENHGELLAGVSGSSVRHAKEWLAARFPQPDVPGSIRKCPERVFPGASSPATARVALDRAGSSPATARVALGHAGSSPATARVGLGEAASSVNVVPPNHGLRAPTLGRVEPLSRDRFLLKLTVSRAVRDKLELARDLMSHGNPSRDWEAVVERALDALLGELGKRKLGRARRPPRQHRPAKPTHVTNRTRREVVERDGLGCCFVAPGGRRCGARAFLEFDHETPKGRGGGSEPDNVRLLCRAHNFLAAETTYGTAHMNRAVSKSRKDKI